jgi:acyl transferase domain-containing protein
VRGEGCGMVVLRRLGDALLALDDVLAVVEASVCNSDGKTNGLTAPSPVAQRRLLETALHQAGLVPADVTCVELHGTGTPLGDPLEYEAAAGAYGDAADRCWLGSVKANIGHLEAAAGVASFVKAVEAVRRAELVPQLHLSHLNPHIALDGTRFAVPEGARHWDTGGKPRRAGVSSFGFGGTNVHAIVGEPPDVARDGYAWAAGPVLVVVSARSPEALQAHAAAIAGVLAGRSAGELPGYAAALARRRTALDHRIAVMGEEPAALSAALVRAAAQPCVPAGAPRVAFVPSGQEAEPAELLALLDDPITSAVVREFDDAVGGHRLLDPATADRDGSLARLRALARYAALTARWRLWGVEPVAGYGTAIDPSVSVHFVLSGQSIQNEKVPPPGLHTVRVGPEQVDRAARLAVLGQLWRAGCRVDWTAVYPGPVPALPLLPTYPWQRERYWVPLNGERHAPVLASLLSRVQAWVAHALGDADPEGVNVDVSARDLGLDSMAFVELKNRVEDDLGRPVPITAFLEGSSLREIVAGLTGAKAALLDRVDELSEAELDRILAGARGEWR